MSFDPGFPNVDEDAHLVEQKARILPDYSILSTDSKPTLASADAGRILEETDTGDMYRWTGTQWINTHTAGSANVSDSGQSLTVDTDDGSLSTYHKPDYSQLSSISRPTPAAGNEGATLEETDTGNRYRWTGTEWINTHVKGALNIHEAHVHNEAVIQLVRQETTTTTTLAVASAAEDYQINVTSAAGFAVGDYIEINTTDFERTLPRIVGIAGTTFDLDRRLDVAHIVGDAVTKVLIDMNVLGTLVTPQEYHSGPPPGEIWHITRIIFEMTHPTAGDLGDLGNIGGGVTNGIIIRALIGGNHYTFTNWKTNADIKVDFYDLEFDTRASGGGTYGTSGRGTFTNLGVALRLDGDLGDEFKVYIQDDLSSLLTFEMKIQGHTAVT